MNAEGTTQVVTRIGFAERWLHRARTQCTDGDIAGGLVTLTLADAEVRYALETAGIARTAPRRLARTRRVKAASMLVATAAAAVVAGAWAVLSGPVQPGARAVDGPPVIRFAPVGSLLASMDVPSDATVVTSGAVSGSRFAGRTAGQRTLRVGARPATHPRAAGSSGAPVAARPAARASAGTSPLSAVPPAPAAATTSAAATPFALSEADLIEMVIAASRALQGTGP